MTVRFGPIKAMHFEKGPLLVACSTCGCMCPMPTDGPLPMDDNGKTADFVRLTPITVRYSRLLGQQCARTDGKSHDVSRPTAKAARACGVGSRSWSQPFHSGSA